MLIRPLLSAVLLAACAQQVLAQSTTNEKRCQTLNEEVQREYQAAVSARVPSSSPTSHIEKGTNVKDILSMDTSAGFSKLLSTGFNKLLNTLLDKAYAKVSQTANNAFNRDINDILGKAGVPSMNFTPLPTTLPPSVSTRSGAAPSTASRLSAPPAAPTDSYSRP